jgi:hypothetical protein
LNGKEEKLVLKPLSGKYIGRFYKVLNALSQAEGKDEKQFLSVLDEELTTTLHSLIIATLERSYPNKYTPEDLDDIASKHLLTFIQPIISVNMPEQ